MSEPFIAEIKMFAGNFAPRGWSFCDGQLLQIAQNTALFSLVGTIYGGNGRTDFGLPDLRGRFPMHPGDGPGLTPRSLGQKSGTETHTLAVGQLPPHNHLIRSYDDDANRASPAGNVFANSAAGNLFSNQAPDADMSADAMANTGNGQSVNHVSPFLCVNFIIALVGIFPSRN